VLSGTVTDPAGKPVAGASITVKNVAAGQSTETRTDSAGFYDALNLMPGDYEVSVAAPGFSTTVAQVTITSSGRQTMNLTLRGLLLLEDLGFPLAQAQGSAQDQATFDKRSHMLKLHQRYGLIAAVPLAATVITGSFAGAKAAPSNRTYAALPTSAAPIPSAPLRHRRSQDRRARPTEYPPARRSPSTARE
jgi:hypothetical protein